MNNNNSDDFFKGFSAVDSEDRIDRIDPTKEDPNRPEPTFGDRSISNNLENDDGFTEPSFCQSNYSENNYSQNIFQITHTRIILLSNQEIPQMSA